MHMEGTSPKGGGAGKVLERITPRVRQPEGGESLSGVMQEATDAEQRGLERHLSSLPEPSCSSLQEREGSGERGSPRASWSCSQRQGWGRGPPTQASSFTLEAVGTL